MENQEANTTQAPSMVLDAYGMVQIKETAKWAKTIAIIGFVMMGIMLLFGIFGIVFAFTKSNNGAAFGFIPLIFMMAIMLVLYGIPCYYLLQFYKYCHAAILERDSAGLSKGLAFLKSHFNFIGVLIIIGIAFYAVVAIGMLIGFAVGGSIFNGVF
ncbi:MAG: hypothetical protein K9H61_06465 [Bacteroidia bacterium]|nr:hypothetical protein [Bacteroidia bacterium]MCF8427873.1 hypothetical protein [Bacteroidia bacterium]MCF8446622.1 hypothetical protein [Bacteroidia bacterium]